MLVCCLAVHLTYLLAEQITENGKMECAGQDRGSRYRTAHNFLLEGNSCMDQERHSEVLSPLPANSLALLGSFTDSCYLTCACFVMHFVMHANDNSSSDYFSMHASSHLFAHLLTINSTITSHPGMQSSERARHVQACAGMGTRAEGAGYRQAAQRLDYSEQCSKRCCCRLAHVL